MYYRKLECHKSVIVLRLEIYSQIINQTCAITYIYIDICAIGLFPVVVVYPYILDSVGQEYLNDRVPVDENKRSIISYILRIMN